jgi:hypothetical protein
MEGELQVHFISREELKVWQQLMRAYHPLGLPKRGLPGELLRYVALLDGRWVALLAWSSAALRCEVRDKFIGWSGEERLKNLKLVTNNVRFLILPWVRIKNLASKILSENLKRLSRDYEEVYGHPVVLAETFVDLGRYRGSCYRAANFRFLGMTRGFSKNNKRYYPNGRPKGVFIYPLRGDALGILKGEKILIRGGGMNTCKAISFERLPVEGLVEALKKVEDPRSRRGRRYPLWSLLALSVCAIICGVRSFRGIGEWVKNLPREVLRRFGKFRGVPDEATIRRALQRIELMKFEAVISRWVIEAGVEIKGRGIAIDGKTIKGSRDGEGEPAHILSAIIHKEGVAINSKVVSDKTNEIKEAIPLLEPLDITGAVITADALLTQREIAAYIVEEKKADYLFTVKGNQETLRKDIEDHFNLESFSPSAYNSR